VHYLVALLFVLRLLRRRKEPVVMVAWIFAILTIPVLGMVAYYLLASDRLRRKASRRRRRVAFLTSQLRQWAQQHATGTDARPGTPPEDLRAVQAMAERLGDMPVTRDNEVRVLGDAEETYAALADAIRAARHHVHLEYYIWRADDTGRFFRDLLVERARAGIRCRLLLDAVGCWGVRRSFLKPLVEAGVRVAFFMPLYPFRRRRRWSLHLRNHRKIAVIDGQQAFIGSQNVGDEYRGRVSNLSPWFDSHVRIVGPAALFLQQTFAEDWYLAARERLDDPVYFPEPVRPGTSPVQVLPTGPDQAVSPLAQIVFAAVSSATTSIRIVTPYFVPDVAARMALVHACYRGVRVRLVLPTRSDVPLALWAARSFYAELIDAGVEIHEFDAGVLHAKLITVDDRWCLVGSANMDARSFRLNFEVTALIYDGAVAAPLGGSIDAFCGQARRIEPREAHRQGGLRQLGEGVARLFSPLL
jgi:cardiolipin synthase